MAFNIERGGNCWFKFISIIAFPVAFRIAKFSKVSNVKQISTYLPHDISQPDSACGWEWVLVWLNYRPIIFGDFEWPPQPHYRLRGRPRSDHQIDHLQGPSVFPWLCKQKREMLVNGYRTATVHFWFCVDIANMSLRYFFKWLTLAHFAPETFKMWS